MSEEIIFNITPGDSLKQLKYQWLDTLTSPQDGMWESFRNNAVHWEVSINGKLAGYACIHNNDVLIQYFVVQEFQAISNSIFHRFILEKNIKDSIVGTNNPGFLSAALHFQKEIKLHTYLFREVIPAIVSEKAGTLTLCEIKDLDSIVTFCHLSVGAPVEWLNGYISDLISKREVYVLKEKSKIIGTCEVRNSISHPEYADIGMIVSPEHRRKGYGTYLLSKASEIAFDQGRKPICSCEVDNMGSFKSISNSGFISQYQLLAMKF